MELENLFKKTYSGKKVFITGHTGFKGSWLTIWLQNLGAEIKGYSLAPDEDQLLFPDIEKKLNCETIISDIRNKEKLESEIIKFKPDFIFHLAAQALVRYSYSFPLETFETNITGTANLLNSLIKLDKKCTVVIVTTDKVYENKEWIYPYRENDELGGFDPYSASKAAAEIVTRSMRNSFFNLGKYNEHQKAVSTARAGNVIGGGDYSKDRIIPDIIKAVRNDETINIRNPDSVRPWQHVLDPLSGYLLLGSKLSDEPERFTGAYNFGPLPESNLTVKELAGKAVKFFGKGKLKISDKGNEPHEAGLLKLDISKAMSELEWKPKWNSETAVEKTIRWYKDSFQDPGLSYDLCLGDISSYK